MMGMAMDMTNLSSNWKKLQETLKNGSIFPPQEQQRKHGQKNKVVDNGSSSRALKRKAETELNGSHATTRVKQAKTTNTASAATNTTAQSHSTGAIAAGTDSKGIASSISRRPTQSSNYRTLQSNKAIQADSIPPPPHQAKAGKYIAIDCEMVGTHSLTAFCVPVRKRSSSSSSNIASSRKISKSHPSIPEYSILARVSVVSFTSETLYDAYVLPPSGVTICDYRTEFSGIRPQHLHPSNENTKPVSFEQAQKDVADLLQGRILVGHALSNDLLVLGLTHPRLDIRDTARFSGYRALAKTMEGSKGRTPALRRLAREVLGLEIQGRGAEGHDSIEDARTAMELFKVRKNEFDGEGVKRRTTVKRKEGLKPALQKAVAGIRSHELADGKDNNSDDITSINDDSAEDESEDDDIDDDDDIDNDTDNDMEDDPEDGIDAKTLQEMGFSAKAPKAKPNKKKKKKKKGKHR